MKKLITVSGFILVSVSLAAPIIGSKQNVTLSSFCKKYHCVLVRSGPVVPNNPSWRPELKSFDYTVNQYSLNVIINTRSNTVNSAGFNFNGIDALRYAYKYDGGTYVNDFSLSFAGFMPQYSLDRICLENLKTQGEQNAETQFTSGVMGSGGRGIKISCIAAVKSSSGFPNKTMATVSIGQ